MKEENITGKSERMEKKERAASEQDSTVMATMMGKKWYTASMASIESETTPAET